MKKTSKFWLDTLAKILSLLTIIIALMVVYNTTFSRQDKSITLDRSDSALVTDFETKESSFEIAFMGDMLAHKSISDEAILPEGSYNYTSLVSPKLVEYGSSHDLMYCNQEVSTARSLPVKGYPLFNADVDFVNFMDNIGCNIIGIANNHSYDNGQTGIDETLQAWDAKSIKSISGINSNVDGADALAVFQHNGIKIGFTAFAQYSNTVVPTSYSVNLLGDVSRLNQQLSGLRAKSDLVIVAVHWGTENSHTINSNQREWAQKLSELGADIIVGTGPHVVQPFETVVSKSGRQTHVWYSIGNAINAQANIDQLISGVFTLTITSKKDGQPPSVHSPKVMPTFNTFDIGANGQILGHRYMLLSEAQDMLQNSRFNTSYAEQLFLLEEYVGSNVKVLN